VRIAWLIDHVDLDIDAPVAGIDITETYFNNLTSGCQVAMYYPQWYKNGELVTYGSFEAGASYKVVVDMNPKSNYGAEFADNVTATVNNQPADVRVDNTQWVEIEYDFGICPTAITNVELILDAPKQNGTPAQSVESYDSGGGYIPSVKYSLKWEASADGETWTAMTSNTFSTGTHYRATVSLQASQNYVFPLDPQNDPDLPATINGYSAEVLRCGEEDPSQFLSVRFNFGLLNDNVIEQIDIDGIIEPVVGEKPGYTCAISGNGYTINNAYSNGTDMVNGIGWYDVTLDKWMRPNMTFQIGHQYKVFVDVKTEDGYEFYTTDSGVPKGWGYINDNSAVLGVQSLAQNEQSLSWTFTCQPRTVKSIAVTGLDIPAEGATPDFTAVTDLPAYYTVESIEWYDYTNSADMSPSDTFVDGNEYWVTLIVKPQEEDDDELCKFVDGKTTATLNGIPVKKSANDSWTDVTSGPKVVRIFYRFTVENPKYFVTQPQGTILTVGETQNIAWETNFLPTATEIQYWDTETQDWDQWDVLSPENPLDSYDFILNEEGSYVFRIAAFIDGDLKAVSHEFVVSWESVHEYDIIINYGTASKIRAKEGEVITITADAPAGCKAFDCWEYVDVTLNDANSGSTSFVMPANTVSVTAIYKDHHEYSTYWIWDMNAHWHECSTCYEKADQESHISSGPATEQQAEVCTVCGYEIAPQLNHTHTYSQTWSKDATHHWHAATCGHDVVEGKATHVSSGPATEQQAEVCTVCGYEIAPQLNHTHTYSQTWSKDEAYHWHDCACGSKDSYEEHSFESNTDPDCHCGYVRQLPTVVFAWDGETCFATLTQEQEFLVLVAYYQEGQMTMSVFLDSETPEAAANAEQVKVFFLDKETCAPIQQAIEAMKP